MDPKELAESEGKPIALAWIDAALSALRGYVEDGERSEVVTAALATSFSLGDAHRLTRAFYAWRALGTFTRAREVIAASDRWFSSVTADEALALFPQGTPLPPAYAIFQRGVFFTPAFAPYDIEARSGFGPRCRAAMVVHESVHVIDALSGLPEIHISEWQEPQFSAQTAEESIHNPSAYASFAAQVYEGAIEWPVRVRYGAGRAAD
jgi:hypothetical protein